MLCGASFCSTPIAEDFSDGDLTTNPTWHYTSAFIVSGNAANNNNNSHNQFFTTEFANTNLNDGETLRLTFSYSPEGANVQDMRVGFFDGVAPSANGWNQWSAGQATRDWRGYHVNVGVNGTNAAQFMRNNNTVDDHAYYNSAQIGSDGSILDTNGSNVFRVVRFDMTRSGTNMLMEAFEGDDVDSLISIGASTDSTASAFFDGFNNVSLYHVTDNGQNAHIRYDDIWVRIIETNPTPVVHLAFQNDFSDEIGGGTADTSGTPTFTPGISGYAARFIAGEGDRVYDESPSGLAFDEITLSAWLKIPTNLSWKTAWSLVYTNGGYKRMYMDVNNLTRTDVYNPDGMPGAANLVGDANAAIGDANWHHFAWTASEFEGDTFMYVDGVKVFTNTWSAVNAVHVWYLGSLYDNASKEITVNIDEFKLFDEALVQSQITTLARRPSTTSVFLFR